MLQGPWAGSMQNMHPQLGAAVEEHSIFFMERMPRLSGRCIRSAAWCSTATVRPRPAPQVRDYHIGIKGVDDQGRRYSALNPDVFYWAHATFFMGTHPGRGTVRRRADRGRRSASCSTSTSPGTGCTE